MKQKQIFIDPTVMIEPEVMALATQQLPDSSLLEFYNQFARREIFLNYPIDECCVAWAKQIIEWNRYDRDLPITQRKAIKIYINTPGGDFEAMNAMIDAIQLSKTPCYTIGFGQCSSAGSMILIAPPVERRLMTKSSIVMIHKGSSGINDDVSKIIDFAAFLDKTNDFSMRYVLKQTSITEEQYHKCENKDWYLFSDDCQKLGIVGAVISDIDELTKL